MSGSSRSDVLTHVDSATVYGMVIAVTEARPGRWAWVSLGDLGSLALLHRNIRIPAPPSELSRPGGLLSQLQTKLATKRRVRRQHKGQALSSVRSVINDSRGLSRVRRELVRVEKDPECLPWRTWHIEHEWPEHIRRIKGVIDPAHLDDVAVVLKQSARDLKQLNEHARADPEEFSRRPIALAERAYTADVLVRAIYYDELARLAGHQVVHHSVRRGLLPAAHRRVEVGIIIPRPVSHLLHVITAEARSERTPEAKVNAWVSYVSSCREYLASNPLPEDTDLTDEGAVDLAAKIAQLNQVSPSYKTARRRIDQELNIIAGLTAWVVTPFVGHLGAEAFAIAGRWLVDVPVEWGLDAEERWHYRRLAQRGPGRVLSAVQARDFSNESRDFGSAPANQGMHPTAPEPGGG